MASRILLETGDLLLLETGNAILLEVQPTPGTEHLLLETGDAILLETGDRILLEVQSDTASVVLPLLEVESEGTVLTNRLVSQHVFEVLTSTRVAARVTQHVLEVLVVAVPLSGLVCPTDTTAVVGVFYSSFFVPTGGSPPYTFSVVSGSLPPGLSLNPSTGEISGVPTSAGLYSFTGAVQDALGATAECSIEILVTITPTTTIPWKLYRFDVKPRPEETA